MKRLFALSAFALALPLAVVPAQARAATATADLAVSADVAPSCDITAAALSFGQYDATNGNKAQTALSLTCTPGTDYWIGLGDGGNYTTTRNMANGSALLPYQLCHDEACTDPWTGAEPATHSTFETTNPADVVYGAIAAGEPVRVGTYNDTVVMTVTF